MQQQRHTGRRQPSRPLWTVALLPSPIGHMRIVMDERNRLRVLDWEEHESALARIVSAQCGPGGAQLRSAAAPAALRTSLARYFAGTLHAIDAIPVETGGTPFQRNVWGALRRIRAGTTLSYAMLAARIDCPTAIRAVGASNGSNPISIVIPCHRLIGTNGSLTGYGGGLERKRWLLEHEGVDTVSAR